jgi:hypothetical protein
MQTGRHHLSGVVAAGQLAIAIAYLFPDTLAPARPTTSTIVLELARVGPIWTVWFGLTGVALILALRFHKLIYAAHVSVGASWIGFTFALVLGAVANNGTYLFPIVTIIVGVLNLVLAGSYSRHPRGGGPE